MALPSNVSYGMVVGNFIRAVADGVDEDRYPDGIPLAGLTVKFIPSVDRFRNKTADPPTTIIADPITATTDEAGFLVDARGARGVMLLATDDPDLDPTGWTWGIAISGPGFRTISFNFALPTFNPGDAPQDIATLIQVPGDPGRAMADWLAAVEATQSAVVDAVAASDIATIAAADAVAASEIATIAATDAEGAALRAEAVPVTNDGIMASVASDPESAFATQLAHTIGGGGGAPESTGWIEQPVPEETLGTAVIRWFLRRDGAIVHLKINLQGTPAGMSLGMIPVGYRMTTGHNPPNDDMAFPIVRGGTTVTVNSLRVQYGNQATIMTQSTTNGLCTASWPTDDPWPT